LWPEIGVDKVVSLGTGYSTVEARFAPTDSISGTAKHAADVAKLLVKIAADTTKVHEYMELLFKSHGVDRYFRFNPPIGAMPLDSGTKDLVEIKKITNTWLANNAEWQDFVKSRFLTT